ncbi:MAG: Abi family protein [Bifidobacteriaceae bacterium]|jgi:abortive infection bacteriophage resistance protein|nr:Abi family protein [Bifidobacteriaceae bacterium]
MAEKMQSIENLIGRLKDLGFVNNKYDINVIQFLIDNNYYRVKEYFKYYKQYMINANSQSSKSIDYSNVLKIYDLDSQLRNCLLYGIEIFEITFRSRLIYYFLQNYSPYDYQNKKIYIDKYNTNKNLNYTDELLKNINKWISLSKDPNVLYCKKYKLKIPIWMAVEIMPFDTVSKIFRLLNSFDCKKDITMSFNITTHYEDFEKMVRSIVVLRNTCAHHERLWCKNLHITPPITLQSKNVKNSYKNSNVIKTIILLSDAISEIKQNEFFFRSINNILKKNKIFTGGIYNNGFKKDPPIVSLNQRPGGFLLKTVYQKIL